MSSRLKKNQVDFLHEKNFGFLATVNRDGSPQVSPVWIDSDGEHVLINTAIGRVKEKNTRRDPRVAIAVENHKDPYSWVMIRGRVTDWVEGAEAEAHIDKLAKKYTGAQKFVKSDPEERRVIFRILPDRVSAGS